MFFYRTCTAFVAKKTLLILLFFTPVLNSQGMKKLRRATQKKVQKSSWNEP